MVNWNKKTIKVSRGLDYTYYASPAQTEKPTILLLHGFPDTSQEWSDLAHSHLIPAGYGVIAPDCLGYAGTSKPTDPAAYKYRLMVQDMTDILDAEGLHKVIPLGHDWGSGLAQRIYNLAPGYCQGLGVVNIPYSAPSNQPFDIDAVNDMVANAFGYPGFSYWYLFSAEDGAAVLEGNLASMFDALHVPGKRWLDILCQPGKLREFILTGQREETQAYATEEMRDEFVARFGRDGFEAPLCWYKATVQHYQEDQADEDNVVVNVPLLFVGFDQDYVGRPEMSLVAEGQGLVPHLTKVVLEGSHWGLLDKKKEFGETVVGWLNKNY